MKGPMRYEFKGQLLTARQIAERTGIKQTIINQRLFQGKTGTALTEPPVSRREAAARSKRGMLGGRACPVKNGGK